MSDVRRPRRKIGTRRPTLGIRRDAGPCRRENPPRPCDSARLLLRCSRGNPRRRLQRARVGLGWIAVRLKLAEFRRCNVPDYPVNPALPTPAMLSMKRGRDVKGSDVVDPGPEVGGGQCSSFYRLLEGGPCWWEHSSWSIFYSGRMLVLPTRELCSLPALGPPTARSRRRGGQRW